MAQERDQVPVERADLGDDERVEVEAHSVEVERDPTPKDDVEGHMWDPVDSPGHVEVE